MTDFYRAAEHLMTMDEATWARHANPWSVYTRFTCLPLIALAIWSRAWLGWWALVPLALAILWTWANPRLFPAPTTLDSWAARGVLGERVFLNRAQTPVARHHIRIAHILTGLSLAGVLVLAYGLWALNPWATLCGLILTILPKVWFVDRMVWVLQDSEGQNAKT